MTNRKNIFPIRILEVIKKNTSLKSPCQVKDIVIILYITNKNNSNCVSCLNLLSECDIIILYITNNCV